MAIFSGSADRKKSRRGTVLQGTAPRVATRSFPEMRVTGVVRLYGDKKNKAKT